MSPIRAQYADGAAASLAVGTTDSFIRSSEARTSSVELDTRGRPEVEAVVHGDLEGHRQVEHVLQPRARLDRCRGWRTGVPTGASSAASSAAARSRDASPDPAFCCRPTMTAPSPRCSAGQAIGSTVATTTSPRAVARRWCARCRWRRAPPRACATKSVSPGRPSNGRSTKSTARCSWREPDRPSRHATACARGRSARTCAGCRRGGRIGPCTSAPEPPPCPRTSSTSTPSSAPTTTGRPTRTTRTSRWRSAPRATAGRAWTPPSTRRTSWRSPPRSSSTAAARAPTDRCSSAGTPTRCPLPAWQTALEVLAAAEVEVHVDARDGYTPTPAVSHAILLHNGAGDRRGRAHHRRHRAPGWPTASSSRRRTTRRATAASSTTRRTAARPGRTRPAGSPTAPTSCCAPASARSAGSAWRRRSPRRPPAGTTSSPPTSTTCRTCSTSS